MWLDCFTYRQPDLIAQIIVNIVLIISDRRHCWQVKKVIISRSIADLAPLG